MTKQTLLTVPWPALCENCGQKLAADIVARPDLDVISTWCPHTGAFVMAYAGDLEGKRGVIRWDVTGPMNRDEAEQTITKLGAESASIENLEKARMH